MLPLNLVVLLIFFHFVAGDIKNYSPEVADKLENDVNVQNISNIPGLKEDDFLRDVSSDFAWMSEHADNNSESDSSGSDDYASSEVFKKHEKKEGKDKKKKGSVGEGSGGKDPGGNDPAGNDPGGNDPGGSCWEEKCSGGYDSFKKCYKACKSSLKSICKPKCTSEKKNSMLAHCKQNCKKKFMPNCNCPTN